MSQLQESGEISTGDLLDGRYRLEERIGEGGMARVYRAEDTVLGRTVAVKVLRTPVDGLGAIERARSETNLLASLSHHGLVTLFDAHVSEQGGSYLVMEYVEGITLLERIRGGPIDPAEAASLTIDIAEALHVAHAADIVHRDIKPSNVLLWKSPLPGREWRAKIADFGIAYLLDSSRITTPGLMVGTMAYIAPEQARGAAPAPAADIYALGLVLIEALSGTRPFADAEGIGTVMARLASAPKVPDSLDEAWQQLLRGMTATRPTDRPTALEVAVAASRMIPVQEPEHTDKPTVVAAAPLPPPLPPPPPPTTGATAIYPLAAADLSATGHDRSDLASGRRERRRRRGIIATIVAGSVLLASLIGGALWWASPSGVLEPAPSQPVEEQVVVPDVEQQPVVEDPAQVGDTGDDGNSGPGDDDDGNDNSGPGNNNGNGNGNGNGRGGDD